MSDSVICVRNVSKHYVLGKNGSSEGLRHAIHNAVTAPLLWLKQRFRNREMAIQENEVLGSHVEPTKGFWALKNVSFDVKQGEVVGIIGRNGAGKSTLLKILSRITEQTEGRVEITGRVASLLEVGTGFHAELTGRENIFLNGAILGMGRGEIRRKFDEIVAFAEVEKFLDTPVKRYSSGMYVRLAFAVAAHLEPEILIVDEVLAVGDAEFQRKCLGKMHDVAKGGRTVLFVSHNLLAIRQLCGRAVLLQKGELVQDGSTTDVTNHYAETAIKSRQKKHFQGRETGFVNVHIVNDKGVTAVYIVPDQPAYVELRLKIQKSAGVTAGFTLFNQSDVPLFLSTAAQSGIALRSGDHVLRVRLPTELLQPGHYRIEGAMWDAAEVYHQDDNLCHFEVMPSAGHDLYGRTSSAQFVLRESWVLIS